MTYICKIHLLRKRQTYSIILCFKLFSILTPPPPERSLCVESGVYMYLYIVTYAWRWLTNWWKSLTWTNASYLHWVNPWQCLLPPPPKLILYPHKPFPFVRHFHVQGSICIFHFKTSNNKIHLNRYTSKVFVIFACN